MATRQDNKRQHEQQKAFFLSLLGGVCKGCGATKDLEIDHVDPEAKSFTLSSRRWSAKTIDLAIEELKKCQALCSDCHKEKTRREAAARPKRFEHGTIYGWMKIGCGCGKCTVAKAAWHDKRNAARRSGARGPYQKRIWRRSRVGGTGRL